MRRARGRDSPIRLLFDELLERHGPQGWWPLYDPRTGTLRYHPGDYSLPGGARRLEVIVGAVLTQNTSWRNVVPALHGLRRARALDWATLLELGAEQLEELIRSSGYFRQKARKLREVAACFHALRRRPRRPELLALWGVGPETADSILLYAYGTPVMVVDAYLRRVLARRGFEHEASLPYEKLRVWVEAQVTADPAHLNELHALVVVEGKRLRSYDSNPPASRSRRASKSVR